MPRATAPVTRAASYRTVIVVRSLQGRTANPASSGGRGEKNRGAILRLRVPGADRGGPNKRIAPILLPARWQVGGRKIHRRVTMACSLSSDIPEVNSGRQEDPVPQLTRRGLRPGGAAMADVLAVVREAGRLIERHRAQGLVPVEKPGGAGPVTAADRAADAFLFHELRSIYPAGWLSEERADDPGRLAERFVWIVDPLDGTREFVEGVPQYSISVALVEAGEPILGVIHDPATGESFQAEREGGAFRNGKRIHVVEGGAVLASRTEVHAGEFARFEDDWEVRASGSTALKLAHVATGGAAVTWSRGPKWEWDVCAGALLVLEAGGRATDALGCPLAFNAAIPRLSSILAGAPVAWERAARAIAQAGLTRQAPATRRAP